MNTDEITIPDDYQLPESFGKRMWDIELNKFSIEDFEEIRTGKSEIAYCINLKTIIQRQNLQLMMKNTGRWADASGDLGVVVSDIKAAQHIAEVHGFEIKIKLAMKFIKE